ncbi:MAG TPA: TlpA disulfide reductase family protein [Candidatus Eisenbacteria bacterium]
MSPITSSRPTIRSSDSRAIRSGGRRRALRGAARLLASGALAALLATLLAGGCGGGAKTGGGPAATAGGSRGEIGKPAPSFTLPDLDGKSVASSAFQGKVVILDFWATWCPPCKEEIPHLVNLQAKYRDRGLAIVGLSLDAGGANDVKPFADEHEVNYTMLIANDDVSKAFGGITMIPTTFVLDRSGVVVKRFIGYTPPEAFEETIQPLLGAS